MATAFDSLGGEICNLQSISEIYFRGQFSHQLNLLKVKNSIDAESEDHYNKNLLGCNREITVNSKKENSEY